MPGDQARRSSPPRPVPRPPKTAASWPFEAPELRSLAEVDPELREYLREWRRNMARQQGIPAFLIMHDTSLEELCRRLPRSLGELLNVTGFGNRKVEIYGAKLLDALAKFQRGARSRTLPAKTSRPAEETMRLLSEGHSFEQIAKLRGRQRASVVSMVADLVEQGKLEFQPGWIEESRRVRIEEVCRRLGVERLSPLKNALPEDVSFDEVRLVVAQIRRARTNAARPGRAEAQHSSR
jgi:ATP-dependent DNA helicase RecQ